MIQIFAAIPALYLILYWSIKPYQTAWNTPNRGFHVFENKWPKIFIYAGLLSTLIASTLHLIAHLNPMTSILVGTISGMLTIGSHTDSITGKVPAELSDGVLRISFLLGIATLVYNSFPANQTKLFDTIFIYTYNQPLYLWILGGLGACLLGFLAWLKSRGILGVIGIVFSCAGLFVAAYMGLQLIHVNFFPESAFANYFLNHGLASMLAFVILVVAFHLAAGDKMGGADTSALYAMGWAFAGIVGHVWLAVGLIAASFFQIILHTFAKKLHIGRPRVMGYSKSSYWFKKQWWKLLGKGIPPTQHTVWAVPFLPVMNTVMVGTVLLALFTGGAPI